MVIGFHVSLSAKLIGALPIVVVAVWMATRREGPWTLMRLAGLVLILVGLGLATLARIQLESSKRTGLLTRGMYSRIRHPMYLFYFVAFAGLLLYLNEVGGIPLLLLLGVFPFRLARREEQDLEALYGEQYRRYKQQTWF